MFTYTIRKDGRLMKKVTINGKPKYLYSNDAKDLEKQFIEAKFLSYKGIGSEDNIRLDTFSQKWLELNSANKEYRTINEYETNINKYIIPKIGKKRLKDIKIYDVKQIMKDMENIPTTAKKVLQLIKRILDDAVDNDFLVKNVAKNIKAPKIIKKEKFPLTKKEDEILLNSKSKYSPFFILMRYTGMRKEEIVPLTIKDIDLANKTISINKAVTFIHNQPVLKPTKNTKTRTVPLLDVAYDIVKELVENSNNLLFTKETDGKMLTDSAIKRHLESFLYSINKDIDEPIKFTCHQLRHSYCTMLYYAGVKIKKAQELMGHASADMVYDIYTHLDEQRENAENLINSYINEHIKAI
jgi:integrase